MEGSCENIKKSRTTDKGWSSGFGVGRGLAILRRVGGNVKQASVLGSKWGLGSVDWVCVVQDRDQ
jgi:hypothetical protein